MKIETHVYSICVLYADWSPLLSFTEGSECHTYSYGVRAVIKCLPAWFRFVQCLRRYRDTKRAFPHLVNAGKYSTTFFAVTFTALYHTHKGKAFAFYMEFLGRHWQCISGIYEIETWYYGFEIFIRFYFYFWRKALIFI